MHRVTPRDQAVAGFGVEFKWDVDLLTGYQSVFLSNKAKDPALKHFWGVDVPGVTEALRTGGVDTVLVTGWHLKGYLQTIWAAKQLGIPVLVRGDSQLMTQRSGLKNISKKLLYPALLRSFDAALYVGRRSQEYWLHYSFPERRLFFSPHCVDNDWFASRATTKARNTLRERLGISPQTEVAMFAGKLIEFKRPLDLIEATAIANSSGRRIEVLIAGAGLLQDELVQKAREKNVRLHSLGFCNQTEMPSAYAAADLVVLPSNSRETWGLVTNEALACGRPVLVSDACGCAPDLVCDGDAGAMFPAGDVTALAERMCRLFNFPPSRSAISNKIRKYSLFAAADGIEAAMESVEGRAAC